MSQGQLCADGVRHHWMPQFRPNSLPSQTPTTCYGNLQLPQPLAPCLTHGTDASSLELTDLRKESRFFPLSAFLATPKPAVPRLALSTPTAAPPSPPPTPSFEAELPAPMPVPDTPLSITPSSTASPALTIWPVDFKVKQTHAERGVAAVPALPMLYKLFPKAQLHSVAVQQDIDDFLEMGHANPCWCGFHTKTVSPATDLVVIKSRDISEWDLDSVLLTPSSLGSDFEELESINMGLLEEIDKDWSIIKPGERNGQPCVPGTANVEYSPAESRGSWLTYDSFPTDSQTSFGSFTSPPQAQVSTSFIEPTSPESFVSDPWTPSMAEFEEAKCQHCAETVCRCERANTSAVEWPTLQEAVTMKRTRREKRSGSGSKANEADVTKFCNQMVDWMV